MCIARLEVSFVFDFCSLILVEDNISVGTKPRTLRLIFFFVCILLDALDISRLFFKKTVLCMS